MEHSQIKILYYPKYTTNIRNWVAIPIAVQAYLNITVTENIGKKVDGCNLPFMIKSLYSGEGTYIASQRKYIVENANWRTNQYTWHTLIDKVGNRYVIENNTKNTLTLANPAYFKMNKQPQSGEITIMTPDFKNEDILEIYGWKVIDGDYEEPADFADKIVFVGQVSGLKIKNDNRGTQINLKLTNLLELLLKTTRKWTIGPNNYPTAPDKINYIAQQVSNMNNGVLQIIWAPTNPVTTTTGEAFPPFQYFMDDASAFDAITDLSSMYYTKDIVDYYIYLKPVAPKTYYLYWLPKTKTATKDLLEGVDFDFLEFDKDQAEVISTIVVVCGRDCNNNPIRQTVTGDYKDGSRTKRMASDITNRIYMMETYSNPAAFDIDSENSKYPISFPYTTATSVTQDEVNVVKGTISSNVINKTGHYTLTTKSKYNEFIRHLSRARALLYGKLFLLRNNKSFDKLIIKFYNTPALQIPGEANRLIVPSIGWTKGSVIQQEGSKVLRLTKKQVSIDKDGIEITCDYTEDPDAMKLPID